MLQWSQFLVCLASDGLKVKGRDFAIATLQSNELHSLFAELICLVLSCLWKCTTMLHCFTASQFWFLVWNQCILRPTHSLHHDVHSFLVWLQSHLASSRSLTASRWLLLLHPSSAGCLASSSPQAASFPFLSVNWTKKLDIFSFGPLSNRHKPSQCICQKSSAHNLRENGHEALSTTSALERDTFYLSPHHLS